jgi:hypothetical protein
MAMPALLPRYTIEDLARFPDDGNRQARAEHDEVVFTPPAGGPPLHIPVSALFEQIIDLPSTG